MKCKDCAVAVACKCPTCSDMLIICNGKELIEYLYWDNETIACDGVDPDEM